MTKWSTMASLACVVFDILTGLGEVQLGALVFAQNALCVPART